MMMERSRRRGAGAS